ncbi:MAG: hypothetical protein GC155_14125 [Alphaproteobacteria bacterium]|nr:hypothetical protein [Alphaproteobacteria bacterium]
MKLSLIFVVTLSLLAAGCVSGPPPKDYTAFRAADPHSILVLPALNNTVSVEASDYFLSTVSKPFAERGYYVFPAHMVKSVLEKEGLADTGLIYQADTRRLGRLFDCDAALYISIEKWEAKYAILKTVTTVAFNYSIRSCKTGEELWSNFAQMQYSPQNSSSANPLAALIADAIVAAMEKAAPRYIPLAQQANFLASATAGSGIPGGPYQPAQYKKDENQFPAK